MADGRPEESGRFLVATERFVGRRREREALSGWLDGALAGAPAVVLCGGEPGIGKSCLAVDLAGRAAAAGADVRWARAHEGVGAPPFWLWRQLGAGDGGGEAWVPPPSGAAAPDAGSAAPTDRFALFDAVTREVLATARGGAGLVLIVEDAHWADEPSLLLLRYLVRELRDAPVLVLVTYRTVAAGGAATWRAIAPDLGREPVARHLTLTGLDVGDTAELFTTAAGRPLPAGAAAALHRRTGGNPFFVWELARSPAALPDSLVDAIDQRVASLPVAARELLTAAAVLGEQFPVAVAAAMVGQPPLGCLADLEDAAAAGLVAAADRPGDWRFTHALVCEAVEAGVPADRRAALHRSAAETIAATYADQIEERLADVARHWAAAALDDPAPAVAWARRAADAAMRALAYEESARLYRLALDVGGPAIGPQDRYGLLAALARARWRATDIPACREATAEAVALAHRLGRPDLAAEAVLVVEPVGTLAWDLELRRWCEEALADLGAGGGEHPGGPSHGDDGNGPGDRPGDGDLPMRARLLGRAAEAAVYTGDVAGADETSRRALAVADRTADPAATIAALKARQIALSGPEHTDARAPLAERMTELGVALRRPQEEMWGRLWRIDVCWERGDLAGIAAELPRLGWCVDHVGGPIARWHLLSTRAALAGATGRYDEALATARAAFDTARPTNHPTAFGSYMSVCGMLGHHVGPERVAASQPPGVAGDVPVDRGEVRDAIFGHVGAAQVLVQRGLLDEALAAFRGAGPVERWQPPPYFRVLSWAYGSLVAVALGLRDDVEAFHERLQAERGRFVVAGAGTASFTGPVELHLGRTAAFLGRLDGAAADLGAALDYARGAGAAGFAVEAACELGAVLSRRGGPGDAARAAELLRFARDDAARLGMPPWEARATELLAGLGASRAQRSGPLSARETEVAALVARGMTNRQIAGALFVSERTAQTHVQNILVKLGFSSRSQIAAWVAGGGDGGESPPAGADT